MTAVIGCDNDVHLDFAVIPEFSRARFGSFTVPYELAIAKVRSAVADLDDRLADPWSGRLIECVSCRVKSFDRIADKAERMRCPRDLESVRRNIRDIAGVRIVCASLSDVYRFAGQLSDLPDLNVTAVEDYIASPKPNGYRSLHVMLEVAVSVFGRNRSVPVEVQLRTRAMDVWARFDHAFIYRDRRSIPHRSARELRHAADLAHRLDVTLDRLRASLAEPGAATRVVP